LEQPRGELNLSELVEEPLAVDRLTATPWTPLRLPLGSSSLTSVQEALLAEYEHVIALRLEHMMIVDQPLVLISQLPRSGGTLLMRLLDGHPACHAIPHELSTKAWFGSEITGTRAAQIEWGELHDTVRMMRRFRVGYRQDQRELNEDRDVFPMVLPPRLQQMIFTRAWRQIRPTSARDAINCYMTSYFNAWLDNGNLAGDKRWITGFEPGAISSGTMLSRFHEVYPDGRLISVVRDPVGWFASARRWRPSVWGTVDSASGAWKRSVTASLQAKRAAPRTTLLVAFETLVRDTDAAMGAIASWLGIHFKPCLVQPTFNGRPVKANSSFPVASPGVLPAVLQRADETLAPDEVARMKELTGANYADARAALDV
jgi:hypothetical protein